VRRRGRLGCRHPETPAPAGFRHLTRRSTLTSVLRLEKARMPAARPARHTAPAAGNGEPPAVRLPGSFEDFYLQEYPKVVKLAYALSGSRTGAEDIAQEAFLRAYRDWQRVGSYEHQAAWVRRVAANLATSGLRRRLLEARALARLAARREAALDPLPADNADFWRAVRALPHRQAQAVALYYLGDLSIQQTAQVLDCAEGTVRAHLAKARQALARRLHLDAWEEEA
jgi:RNA polymerase sigma factor (sigma-70 family)